VIGGFVVVVGGEIDHAALDRAVRAFRWHAGAADVRRIGDVVVATLGGGDGPAADGTVAGGATVVHGAAPRPVAELEADGRRFAAVEIHDGRIVAARDPLGLAPLFYRKVGSTTWLATEVAPLAAVASTRPDLEALTLQVALVPDDVRTGYEDIFRVLPGHRLELTAAGGQTQVRYWQPRAFFGTYRGTRSDAEAELHARLLDAVDRTLPVDGGGLLLSGGLDSTAIAAMAAQLRRPVEAVHVAFPDVADAAEERHAREVAAALGFELDVVPGDEASWDPADDLRTSVVPYLTPPPYAANRALDRLAARDVRLALDGNDGDGVLGPLGREWGELLLSGSVGRLVALAGKHGTRTVVHRILVDIVPPELRLRGTRRRPVPPPTYLQQLERYLGAPLHGRMRDVDHERWRSPVGEWRWRQLRQVEPVTTVRFEEHELRAASFGIDMRHPFADRRLVEFLVSLPAALKVDPLRSKDLLRSSLARTPFGRTVDRADKPEYYGVLARRVDPARCLSIVRDSGIRLPHVDYAVVERDADAGRVPLVFLMFLARAHAFAAA